MSTDDRFVYKGRGAVSNPPGRFDGRRIVAVPEDADDPEPTPQPAPETVLAPERARSVISYNRSPDVPFDRSINPYRGCEHGCVYCYARPSHAYLDLSPGLDFETRIFYKPDAARRLAEELARPDYEPAPIALGGNTDAWQPAERRLGVTRAILEVLHEYRHPVSLITKSALVERDLDVLAPMAEQGLVSAAVSVTSLDASLTRVLEPRAAGPLRRLRVIRTLSDAGVPVSVLIAPIIPAINEAEIEAIVERAAAAGARAVAPILLRLPHEVAGLFESWLRTHYPERANHVLSLLSQMHGGRPYDSRFGRRMTGQGAHADLIRQRVRLAARRFGLDGDMPRLDTTAFRVPPRSGDQMTLF